MKTPWLAPAILNWPVVVHRVLAIRDQLPQPAPQAGRIGLVGLEFYPSTTEAEALEKVKAIFPV